MRVLKWLGSSVLGIALLIGAVVLYAPFHDGPLAFIPGGPLESGELVSRRVSDWSFASSVQLIEMQLFADDDRSRTTWILVLDGVGFIPCTLGYPPGKNWHHLAAEHGSALVRVADKRYPVTLRKVEDAQMLETLAAANSAKYPPAPGSDEGSWYFRLEHRGT